MVRQAHHDNAEDVAWARDTGFDRLNLTVITVFEISARNIAWSSAARFEFQFASAHRQGEKNFS